MPKIVSELAVDQVTALVIVMLPACRHGTVPTLTFALPTERRSVSVPTSRTALSAVEVNVPVGPSVIPAWGPFEIVRSHAALAVAVAASIVTATATMSLTPSPDPP